MDTVVRNSEPQPLIAGFSAGAEGSAPGRRFSGRFSTPEGR